MTGEQPWLQARISDHWFREYVHNPRQYLRRQVVGRNIYYPRPDQAIKTRSLSDEFMELLLGMLKVFEEPHHTRIRLAEVVERLERMRMFLVPVSIRGGV